MAIGKDEFPMKLRYGMRHTWRCECSDCLAAFRHHKLKYGTCSCEDCRNTRLWADQKRHKALTENLSPQPVTEAPKVHRHNMYCDYGADCNSVKTEKKGNTVATVNFCERHSCETMAKSPSMGLVVIIPETAGPETVYADAVHTTDRNTVRMELCPGCVGELMEWVDALPAGPRPKAYSKPWKKDATAETASVANMASGELFRLALEASKREMEEGEVQE